VDYGCGTVVRAFNVAEELADTTPSSSAWMASLSAGKRQRFRSDPQQRCGWWSCQRRSGHWSTVGPAVPLFN